MKAIKKMNLKLDKEIIAALSKSELHQINGGKYTIITCDTVKECIQKPDPSVFKCLNPTDMCPLDPTNPSDACNVSNACMPFTVQHQCTGNGCANITEATACFQ